MEQQVLRILLQQQQTAARFDREKFNAKEQLQCNQLQKQQELLQRQLQEQQELQRKHDVESREIDELYARRMEQLRIETGLKLQQISSNMPSNSNTRVCGDDVIHSNQVLTPSSGQNLGECSTELQYEAGLQISDVDEGLEMEDGCMDTGVVNKVIRVSEVMLRFKPLKTLVYTQSEWPSKLCLDGLSQQCSAMRAGFADVAYVFANFQEQHKPSTLLEVSEEGLTMLNSSQKRPPLFSKENYQDMDTDQLWGLEQQVCTDQPVDLQDIADYRCVDDQPKVALFSDGQQADLGQQQSQNRQATDAKNQAVNQANTSGCKVVQMEQQVLGIDEEPFADVWMHEDSDCILQVIDEELEDDEHGGSTASQQNAQEQVTEEVMQDMEVDLQADSNGSDIDEEDLIKGKQLSGLTEEEAEYFNKIKQQLQEIQRNVDHSNLTQLLQNLGPQNQRVTQIQEQIPEAMHKVKDVIGLVVESAKIRWKENKLPKLQKSVRMFWFKGQSSDQIEEWRDFVQHKQNFQEKYIAGIIKSHSSKARKSVIERACQALIPTVEMIEELNWKLGISKLSTAPDQDPDSDSRTNNAATSSGSGLNQAQKQSQDEQQQSELEDFVPISEDDEYDHNDDFIDDSELVGLDDPMKKHEMRKLQNQVEYQDVPQLIQNTQNLQVQEVVEQMMQDVETQNYVMQQTDLAFQKSKDGYKGLDASNADKQQQQQEFELDTLMTEHFQEQQQQHEQIQMEEDLSDSLELFMEEDDQCLDGIVDEQEDDLKKVSNILKVNFRDGCDLLQSMYDNLQWSGSEDKVDWLFPWQEMKLGSFQVWKCNEQVNIRCSGVALVSQLDCTSRGFCIMRPMQKVVRNQDQESLKIGSLVEIQQPVGVWIVGIVIKKERWSSSTKNQAQTIAQVYSLYNFNPDTNQVVKKENLIQVSQDMLDEGLVRKFFPWDASTGQFFDANNQHIQDEIFWFWRHAHMFLEKAIFDQEINRYVCRKQVGLGENWLHNNKKQLGKIIGRKLARKQVYIGSEYMDMLKSGLGELEWRLDQFHKKSVCYRYQVDLVSFFRKRIKHEYSFYDEKQIKQEMDVDGRCRIPRRGLKKRKRNKSSEEEFICINENGDQVGTMQNRCTKIQKSELDNRPDDVHFIGCPHFIEQHLKEHQRMGLKFLWKNIIQERRESVLEEEFDSGGVILAHSMGLGKTLQTIAFLCIFHRRFPSTRSLVVCPKNVQQNWLMEFQKWLEPAIIYCPNSISKKENNGWDQSCSLVAQLGLERLKVYICNRQECTIRNWQQHEDNPQFTTSKVLLITYNQFQRKVDENGELGRYLLEIPDIVVADEGHVMKTHDSKTCQAMRKIKTDKKIALTGYPLQNNLQEYYCMISWVRPGYLGPLAEFEQDYGQIIKAGSALGATPEQIQQKNDTIILFQLVTKHIVQRYGPSHLEKLIRFKNLDHVLLLLPSQWQIKIYQILVKYLKNNPIVNNSLFQHLFNAPTKFKEIISKVLVEKQEIKKEEHLQQHLAEGFQTHTIPEYFSKQERLNESRRQSLESMSSVQFVDLTLESSDGEEETDKSEGKQGKVLAHLSTPVLEEINSHLQEVDCSLQNTPKGQLIIRILKQCLERCEKTIIFSELLAPMAELENILRSLNYTKGVVPNKKTYLTIQGQDQNRQQQIQLFQNNQNIMVMLMSLKACSLGINVTCASNVIFIDSVFNPVHIRQAIARIHRIGKTRVSHVYRLLYDSTMEHKVYKVCTEKERLFLQVVDAEDVKAQCMADHKSSNLEYQVRQPMSLELLSKYMSDKNGQVIEEVFRQEYMQCYPSHTQDQSVPVLPEKQCSIVEYFLHDSQLQQEEEEVEVVDSKKEEVILKKHVETQSKETGQITQSKSKRIRRLNKLYNNGNYQLY